MFKSIQIRQRKKSILFISLIVFFLLFGIIIPKVFIKDDKNISKEELDCAKFESWIVFDNPIERILTIKMAATNKEVGKINVTVHTIFGIKYAIIEAYCDGNLNRGANLIQRNMEF